MMEADIALAARELAVEKLIALHPAAYRMFLREADHEVRNERRLRSA